MATLNKTIEQLRTLALIHADPSDTDADLLKRFVRQHDERAFETLIRRHGPLVLGVCRRLLKNLHDAEDAFQVTFLVLARKARSIRKPASLASWLHGVAHRTALKARDAIAKRRAKEMRAMARTEAKNASIDLSELLDQELAGLVHSWLPIFTNCWCGGDVPTQLPHTELPGYVVYEDAFQVVAVPFRDTRA